MIFSRSRRAEHPSTAPAVDLPFGNRVQTLALLLKDPAAPVWPVDGTWRVAMNWDQIEGNWMKAKGKLRQQWASSPTTT
jgi:hypothetical protein